jgi:cyclohexadieny/prephenate dehydrogenase
MLFDQITILGVGLIGGSVGLAVKARGVAQRVVGFGRSVKNLERAVELGCLDHFATTLTDAVRNADLVVVCTPVDKIASTILESAPHCKAGTLFTDGGSTKGNILAELGDRLPGVLAFVPAHPLAGSEKTGPEYAKPGLFHDRVTILTPTPKTDPKAVAKVEAFWKALGCRIVTMTPDEHDRALGTTSHLPHAAAAGVAGVTPPNWLTLTAGGFRDTTRIAGGDPALWAAIFLANREAVLDAVHGFNARMAEFHRLLDAADRDGIVRWLSEAKQVRDALGS